MIILGAQYLLREKLEFDLQEPILGHKPRFLEQWTRFVVEEEVFEWRGERGQFFKIKILNKIHSGSVFCFKKSDLKTF